jgi:hypothetical protein
MNGIENLGKLLKAGALGGKYYKRTAKPGGGYRYFYTKEEYDKRKRAKPEPQTAFDFGAPGKPAPKSKEMIPAEKPPTPKKQIPELHESEVRIVRGAIRAGVGGGILGRPDDKWMMRSLVDRGVLKISEHGKKALKMAVYEITPLGHAAVETYQMKESLKSAVTSPKEPTSPMHPAVRKKDVMAVFKKFKAVGNGRVMRDGKHRIMSMASGNYKLYVLEDLSSSSLKSLAAAHNIQLPSESAGAAEKKPKQAAKLTVSNANDMENQLRSQFGNHPGFAVKVEPTLDSTLENPKKSMVISYSLVPTSSKRLLRKRCEKRQGR